MRLSVAKNIPRLSIYFALVALLLVLLAISGTSNEGFSKTVSESDIQKEQKQVSNQTTALPPTNNGPSSEDSDTNQSSETKVKISVKTNTTNGETTGSTNVKVATNGKTQDFSEALDECLTAGKIKVSTEDSKIKCESEDGSIEIDWDSENDTEQESEFSSETDISVKNKQRD
jgi:hypothetical protein